MLNFSEKAVFACVFAVRVLFFFSLTVFQHTFSITNLPGINDMRQEFTKLDHILNMIENTADNKDQVSLGMIMDALGRRSFGPILLLAGLITLAPIIGDIPGMPTIMGAVVLLTAVQLLIRREHVWMPQWMLRRSVRKERLCKALEWIRPVARFLDRFTRPRLSMLIREAGVAVSPGVGFGEYGDDHVRFALIENKMRTNQAIRGIKKVLQGK